jgi:hypothetical protein
MKNLQEMQATPEAEVAFGVRDERRRRCAAQNGLEQRISLKQRALMAEWLRQAKVPWNRVVFS